MPRISKKTTSDIKEANEKKPAGAFPEPFSKECFTQSFPLAVSGGDNTPMWWKIVREPGVTFKQYKKDKKRAEKEKAQLEDYVRTLEAESEKYSKKLKAESEKYRLECEMREHAFNARREKEELELAAEREKSRQRLLEEQINSKNKIKEFEQSLEEEKERKREEEATRKYELKRAKIEAEEKVAREKILADEEAEKLRLESLREAERKKEERRERERELKRKRIEAELLDEEEANAEKVRLAQLEAERKLEEEEKLSRELALREEESQKELEERERVRMAHREDRIKRAEEEKKRLELAEVAKRKTIATLRRAHKIKDVEFVYPEPAFGEGEEVVLELSGAHLKERKGKKALSVPVTERIKSGVTITTSLKRRDMIALCSILRRDFSKDKIMSGGIRFEGKEKSHALTRKEYLSKLCGRFSIVDYEAKQFRGLFSVKKYLADRIGEDKIDLATDYLQRLNVHSAKSLIKKRATSLAVGEVARVLLVCALLSSAKVVVLCEPQRCLDMPARSVLKELISEWQGEEEGRALWVLTSDEELYKG